MCDNSERRESDGRGGSHPAGADPGRRRFISLLAWGAATACFPRVAGAARSAPPKPRSIAFHNLHTGERFDSCYWERGVYIPEALAEIDTILRDHRTGEVKPISPQLLDLVFSLRKSLGSAAPVQVISGYRSVATNTMLRASARSGVAGRSLHLTGKAIDLAFEARPLRQVRDAALALRAGGVGYYPKSGFVHVDIGRPRRW